MKRMTACLALAIAVAAPARAEKPAADPGWTNFHAIIWQDQSAPRYRALPALGVDAARAFGFRGPVDPKRVLPQIAPILDAGLRFYLENIATDFYSAYHRWTPEHPNHPDWLFTETKRRYRANPADPTVFDRTPGLSDPVWLARIAKRMRANGAAFARYRPLFYNLGDEPGIADLAAAWDFDRSPTSLAAMRVWLRRHYPSLAALNHQWGTAFADWAAVTPPTTTETLARTDGNYAAWTDFRSFMDEAFAHALRVGTDALHQGDPAGLAGIEGTQAPGPGGYDYIRLAHAVDLMEMYGGGDSIDIARSFNPDLIVLTTSFGAGPAERKRIWHSMLLGGHGVIRWDGAHDFVSDAGVPSPAARDLAPLFRELRDGLGAQLIAARPAPGPVAILYSPTSQHVQWLLDRRAETTPWTDRTSETEWNDANRMRRAIGAAVQELVHLGLSPHFVSARMIEDGLLSKRGAPRALVLPQAVALSPAAGAAIARFAAAGGVVLADGTPGTFDAHGTALGPAALAASPLAALAPRLPPIAQLAPVLARAGITAGFTLRRADGTPAPDVSIRVLRIGQVTLLALEQDKVTAAPEPLELTLAAPAAIHDLRGGRSLAHSRRIAVTLDPVAPTLLAISATPLPAPVLSGPSTATAGTPATWRLVMAAPAPAATHALRVRVFDPSGAVATAYSGVRVLSGTAADWRIGFAADAAPGRWRIEVTDMLGGGVAATTVALHRP